MHKVRWTSLKTTFIERVMRHRRNFFCLWSRSITFQNTTGTKMWIICTSANPACKMHLSFNIIGFYLYEFNKTPGWQIINCVGTMTGVDTKKTGSRRIKWVSNRTWNSVNFDKFFLKKWSTVSLIKRQPSSLCVWNNSIKIVKHFFIFRTKSDFIFNDFIRGPCDF